MKGKILVVDDDASMTDLLSERLKKRQFEVVTAQSAAEARVSFDAAQPDVVVTDLNMPGQSGVQLCEWVVTNRADTPVKRIYLAVQLMYMARDPKLHHEVYFALVRDLTAAAPSTWPYIENINNQILTGDLYKALKEARKLIAYEEKLLNHGQRNSDLRSHRAADRKSA